MRDDDQGRLDGQWAAVPAAGDFELSRLVTRVKSGEWAGDRVKARPYGHDLSHIGGSRLAMVGGLCPSPMRCETQEKTDGLGKPPLAVEVHVAWVWAVSTASHVTRVQSMASVVRVESH